MQLEHGPEATFGGQSRHSDQVFDQPLRFRARVAVRRCAWSPIVRKIASRTGGRDEVFVVQPAKDRIATDGIRLFAAMARIRMQVVEIGMQRIGYTGTQRHVGTPGR